MKYEYSIALIEKPHDEGLSKTEIMDLYDMLRGTKAIPVEYQAEHSSAMGFINLTDADFLKYDYGQESPIGRFIRGILEDTDKETDDGSYAFCLDGVGDIDIYITR